MNVSASLQAWVGNQLTASFREAIGIATAAIKNQAMNVSASLAHLQTLLQMRLQTQLQRYPQQLIQVLQRHYVLKMVHAMETLVH
jgi:hypothetical protein